MSIETFPIEVLQTIFSYCSRYEYRTLSEVCHRWNAAVEYLLVPQMRLKVSYEDGYFCAGGSISSDDESDDDEYDGTKSGIFFKTKLINKRVLLSSSRNYTSFKLELTNEESEEVRRKLKELLDVCRERYQIEHLSLTGSPNKMMVQLFKGYYDWLQNLTSLEVLSSPAEPKGSAGEMVTLPNLERLRWNEGRLICRRDAVRSNSGRNAFWLNAPKLSFLSISMDNDHPERNVLKSCRKDPDVCHLFLPTLELKAGSELRGFVLTEAYNLNQRYIDDSEQILANLEQLMFTDCENDIIIRICDKCPNLKELSIRNEHSGSLPLQISATLSDNLEILRIENWSREDDEDDDNAFIIYGPAVFSKLRYIYLDRILSRIHQSVSLDAPQLTKIELDTTHFRQSILTHTEQLRTMRLQVLRWDEEDLHPPTNVTDLTLDIPSPYDTESRLVEKYLECVPHLTRLKLAFESLYISRFTWDNGRYELVKIDLTFVEALPKLKHLTIHQASIRLAEFEKLAGLKSLLLSQCVIEVDPSGETPVVVLTALEHVRVDRVTIEGITNNDSFPIQVNERQPHIEISGDSTNNGMNAFSSNTFRRM